MSGSDRLTADILWFEEIGIDDVPLVGGKNASLGEMYQALTPQGVWVPNGFAITAAAYHSFIEESGVAHQIQSILSGLDTGNIADLQERGLAVRHAIMAAELPGRLQQAILDAYAKLSDPASGGHADVAVRSSATAEDLPDASFAGQQETYLNVQGPAALLDACRRCFASLYTDRAISYRVDKGYAPDMRIGLSIAVQHMVRSDIAAAGVMFSIDTETGFANAILINGAYGLGESVVSGAVNPDEFYVFKPTLQQGFRPILRKNLGSKQQKLIYDTGGSRMTRIVAVPVLEQNRFCISDDEILTLANWACLIEAHYSHRRGKPTPMDMEWAKDGQTGQLYIVQARPETVQSRKPVDVIETYRLQAHGGEPLISGRSVGERIAHGAVRVIQSVRDLHRFREGEILVADKTDPDWEPSMKMAAAIITNRGGRTCHAAIVSRELGLPAVVGTERATERLTDGQAVTVSCAGGDRGFVYAGRLPFEVERQSLKDLKRPRTRMMLNVGNPEEAFRLSFLPNDGVGLAREEFIVSSAIRIHPKALLDYDTLTDADVKDEIDRLTAGYADKPGFFVERLAQGVAMIAAAFHPNDVIVRMSDFKTNEYANLIGGKPYEPREENPMIGFRGASRYYHELYRDSFALECRAMKQVRDVMGLTNLKIMIPFCRTVEEAHRVLAEMERNGLRRGENGLDVYVMCELPSNILMAKEFAEVFDGFSIGSNDLTQLILGVDRDSEIVASLFDERNPAVMRAIAAVIRDVRDAGRKIGICGQAPSDYPEFARFLVECGIDSMSLNPDALLRTTVEVLAMESGS